MIESKNKKGREKKRIFYRKKDASGDFEEYFHFGIIERTIVKATNRDEEVIVNLLC